MAEINRKEVVPKFEPVTIVLETQAEVDYVATMLGQGRRDIAKAFGADGELSDYIFSELLRYRSAPVAYLTGTLELHTN